MDQSNPPKLIAFNLPQYHPIPENDEWWGKGFTEWTNVVKARPLFKGHYQPQLPADLGFYDLRLAETREAQAKLAREYGIHGFCYYHYWFNGHRLLERPVDEIVASGKPNFPFCLCWANENWTRVWDGGESQILMQQAYSDEDDLNHIRALLPILTDRRYIKVDGKPVFLVYRATRLPDPRRTIRTWRQEADKAGLPGLYLLRVESFLDEEGDPRQLGFDAALEFQPRWGILHGMRNHGWKWWRRATLGKLQSVYVLNAVRLYDHLVERAIAMEHPSYPWIRCVCPGWDNTARRPERGATVLHASTPDSYQRWLSYVIQQTAGQSSATTQIPHFVFINAWNEWAEGNHLEPCQRWGRSFLEATIRALYECGTHSRADQEALIESH
jgi:lipopolysaccharide biosynthesis protein